MAEELLQTDNIPSIFWGTMTLFTALAMTYLALWGHIYEVDVAFESATVVLTMLFVAVVLTFGEIFYAEKNIMESSEGFTVGFIVFFLMSTRFGTEISLLSQVLSLDEFRDAAINESTAEFWIYFLPNVINPIVEEMMWAVALPVFLILIMHGLAQASRQIPNPLIRTIFAQFDNIIVQMGVLLIVLPFTFAFFHVGQTSSAMFIMAALIFRALLTVLWWGDLQWDLVPFIVVLPSFLVGAHMGNNMGVTATQEGITGLFTLLTGHFIGWIWMFIMFFIFLIGFVGLFGHILKIKRMFT